MKQEIQIYCKNSQKTKSFPIGSSLFEIYKGFDLQMPYGVVSAKVNNHVEGLNFRVYHNKDVEYLDISSESGLRTYVRSLCFVLCKAVADVFPEGKILLEHPVSKGFYCDLRIGHEPTLDDVARIKQRMSEIISADLPFHRIEEHSTDAIRLFEERGMTDKVKLLRTTGRLYTNYYTLDGFVDYYYGSLLPSTGHLHLFDLVKYYDGLLLRFPDKENPAVLGEMVKQEKMLDVFKENHRWQEIIGVSTVGDINEAIREGHATELINVAEALQEKRIARIADDICSRPGVRVVLIAGPRRQARRHSANGCLSSSWPMASILIPCRSTITSSTANILRATKKATMTTSRSMRSTWSCSTSICRLSSAANASNCPASTSTPVHVNTGGNTCNCATT